MALCEISTYIYVPENLNLKQLCRYLQQGERLGFLSLYVMERRVGSREGLREG